MLQRIIFISAILSMFLLTACTPGPGQLGVSQQQWQTMSDQQRQQMIEGYDKIQRQPANATVYAGPKIMVSLSQGKVMMPPFTDALAYEPVQFTMKPGECSHIRLSSVDGNSHVSLPACYNGLTLALDPSRYDPLLGGGSLRFNYIPLWKRGFAYNGVSSQGYVHLTKVRVIINAIVKEGDQIQTNVISRQRPDLQTEPLQKYNLLPKTEPTSEVIKSESALPAEPQMLPTLPATELKTEPPVEPQIELKDESQQLVPTAEIKLAPVEDIENISH